MPSKTLALRLPDDIYAALDAKCVETGSNKSELVLAAILEMLALPTAAATPLEAKVLSLETQMDLVLSMSTTPAANPLEDRLMSLEDRVTAMLENQADVIAAAIAIATATKDLPKPTEAIDLKPTNSTPEFPSTPQEPAVDLDIQQAIIAALKPYPSGGYYFRSEYLGQTKILHAYRQQAIQMGFSSEAVKIDGEKVRVWLNKSYCKQAV